MSINVTVRAGEAIHTVVGENTLEATRQAEIATAEANRAETEADRAATEADQSAAAALTANALGRFFASQAAGEAGSTTGQVFSFLNAGAIEFRTKTGGGSTFLQRSVSPSSPVFSGSMDVITNGDVVSITNGAVEFDGTNSVLNVFNNGDAPTGLRVISQWEGSTGSPLVNNDTSLFVTYTKTLSNSGNTTWAVSASNNYNNIPAGVYDTGERFGVQGWAGSVGITGWVHAGRLAKQTGGMFTAGFQGEGSASTAVVDLATGARGRIILDAAGAEVTLGIGFDSYADGGPSIIKKHVAFRASAEHGTEDNLSFEGLKGRFLNVDPVKTDTHFDAPTYKLSGGNLFDKDGNFHRIWREDGVAIYLGKAADPANVHVNTTHRFEDRSNALLARINAAGVNTTGAFFVDDAQVVGNRGAAVANAAAATYVAPSGGTTVDTEARAALAQLAADNASLRSQLNALLDRLRTHGLIAS